VNHSRRIVVLALTIGAFSLGACKGLSECPEGADVVVVSVDGQPYSTAGFPVNMNVQLGDNFTATAGVVSASGCGYESQPNFTSGDRPDRFTWSTSGDAVTVDSRGALRAVRAGRSLITVNTPGVTALTFTIDVVPVISKVVVSPQIATVHVGDTLRFDAYMADAAGNKVDVSAVHPYPVDLQPDPSQANDVTNYIPGNRFQLVKRFDRPGTYRLRAVTVVRNVGLENAAIITVIP
jgi:hypothetical protein